MKRHFGRLLVTGAPVLAMLLAASLAPAASYTVSTAGSDSGSIGPFRTIGYAVGVANGSTGPHTITVLAGDYAETALPITITQPMTITGPQAGVSPWSTLALRTSGNTATEAVVDFATTAGGFVIDANNVTITGLNILSNATSGALVSTTSGRTNAVVSDNLFSRSALVGAGNADPHRAVDISSSVDALVSGNATINISARNSGAVDNHGAITAAGATRFTIKGNEILNTGNFDRSSAINVRDMTGDCYIEGNRIAPGGPTGNIGKYGIGVFGTNPNNLYIRYNVITHYAQTAIGILSPRVTVEYNKIIPEKQIGDVNPGASIYIRDASITSAVVRFNEITNALGVSGSTSWSGLRVQNMAAGAAPNIDMSGNLIYNNNTAAGCALRRFGFISDAGVTASGCAGAFRLQNIWWGSAAGPGAYTAAQGGCTFGAAFYSSVRNDVCASPTQSTSALSTGDVASTNNAASRQMIFFPWALFRGTMESVTGAAPQVLAIPAAGAGPTGNDRFSQHAISLPQLAAPSFLRIWSPSDRHGVDNSVEFELIPPVAFVGGDAVVTIEYDPATDIDPIGSDELAMRAAYWDGGLSAWVFIPSTVDTGLNTVSAPIANLPSATTFSAQIFDGPLTSITASNPTYTLGTSAVGLVSSASIVDYVGAGTATVTVTIDNIADGAAEVLAATAVGSLSVNYSAPTLTISGTGTDAEFAATLASLTYFNPIGGTAGLRNLSVVASDGTMSSFTTTLTVDVEEPAFLPPTFAGFSVPSYTNTQAVTVTLGAIAGDLNATDTLQLAEDGGFTANLQGYNDPLGPTVVYNVSAGEGSKAISGRVNGPGGSATAGPETVILDTTPPSSSASFADNAIVATTIAVGFTASDNFALAGTELYAATPSAAAAATGLVGTGTSGTFSNFTLTENGLYGFHTRATDEAGNVEAAPAAADVEVAVSILANSAVTLPFSATATSRSFPMESGLNITITLANVTTPGTITVERILANPGSLAVDAGLPSTGFLAPQYLVITNSGVSFDAATLVIRYDEAALGTLNETELNAVFRIDGTTSQLLAIPSANATIDTTANTITVTGITGFSSWLIGNQQATVADWSLLAE